MELVIKNDLPANNIMMIVLQKKFGEKNIFPT